MRRALATTRTTIEATKVFQSVARSSDRARRASTLTKILDGSVWHLEGRKGELVGEDELGNKYYQDVSSQQGRNRWVVPPNADDYSAANVPRGWHGWLHHANDEPGLPNAAAPTYEDDAPRFARGTSSAGTYLPKGHFSRAKPGEVTRSWARYQSWTPDR